MPATTALMRLDGRQHSISAKNLKIGKGYALAISKSMKFLP